MNYLRKNDAGFTLIEMIIVIAILGILAGIAIPYYGNYTQKTKVAGAASVIAGWQTAVEQCILDRGEKAGCNGGEASIPDNVTEGSSTQFIHSLTVTDGNIKAITTGITKDGDRMTLDYTSSIPSGYVEWQLTGTGCNPPTSSRGIDCDFK